MAILALSIVKTQACISTQPPKSAQKLNCHSTYFTYSVNCGFPQGTSVFGCFHLPWILTSLHVAATEIAPPPTTMLSPPRFKMSFDKLKAGLCACLFTQSGLCAVTLPLRPEWWSAAERLVLLAVCSISAEPAASLSLFFCPHMECVN